MAINSPQVTSVDLRLTVQTLATGWNAALSRPPKVQASGVGLKINPPSAISLKASWSRVKTFGFTFPEAPHWGIPSDSKSTASPPATKAAAGSQRKAQTRIQPPREIIKLEDRLYYLLQPPLESLAATNSLRFPFDPFPYQYQGIAFLYPRHAALLADEMGLGKTMQAISTIRMLLCAGELRSVLLICPKPLMTNWQREFELWAPEVPISIIEGDKAKRAWQWRLPAAPVKIANYELLMRDRDCVADGAMSFDLVLLDEAQRIKNRGSTTSQVVRSIARTRSWALTGTPVENSSEDLVGIFEFISPGFLHNNMTARRIGQAARDFIIRRTKDMVLTDLPPKMFRDAELSLTPEQHASYRAAEDLGKLQLNEMGDSITIQHVFELVLRLKQICNFDPLTGASCKLERLEADMEEVAASGHKAIVFSQWVNSLEHLKRRLARFQPLEYHGRIQAKKRDPILKQFKEDPGHSLLLMSYGAGSVGLNLQFCRYVFLFDRWWNPAVEDQAINRAHRIGADGPVTVTRMLTTGTIEERIDQVLEEKRQLFEIVLSSTGTPRPLSLSQSEIFGLFDLASPAPAKKSAA